MVENVFFPVTLEEAVGLLVSLPEAKVLAGGTDLLVAIKEGKEKPRFFVSLSKITSQQVIEFKVDGLRIGATATHQSIAENAAVKAKYTAIAEAAGQIGSWQVRNLATVGGNLCSAVPSADIAPPLLAFGADVKLISRQGERTVPLSGFFKGPMQTVMEPGEILAEINVPLVPKSCGSCYLKLGPRAAVDIALVSAAAMVVVEDGVCRSAGLALGAVAPTPLKVTEAEVALVGTKLTEGDIERAAAIAASAARPIDDHRASAVYRRKMVAVLTRRALQKARELALSSGREVER